MNKVKFELNKAGVRELMLSDELLAVCDGYASKALSSLGSGYEKNSYHGKTRVNVEVVAVSREAKKENLRDNTILKAVRS